jgi:hypothetical protein
VTEACFYLTAGGGNSINAQLLPVCPAGKSTTGVVINPSGGNISFVGKAVADS